MRLYTEMYSDVPDGMEKEGDLVVGLSSSPETIFSEMNCAAEDFNRKSGFSMQIEMLKPTAKW